MLFIKNDLIAELVTQLKSQDFYNNQHQVIFSKMVEMYSKDIPITIQTLINSLNKDILQGIGGMTYIAEVGTAAVTIQNFMYLLKVIKELSHKRNIIKGCMNAIDEAFTGDIESINIVDELETNFITMNNIKDGESTINAAELMELTLNSIEEGFNNGGKLKGITTGYNNLDNALGGLVKQDLILIAARPSMGKTALIINIIDNIPNNKKVLFHELEMSKEKIGIRLLASKTLKNPRELSDGTINPNDFGLITDKCNEVSDKDNLFLNCKAGITIGEIRAEAKKIKLKYGLDILIVDHLGKIKPDNLKLSRNDQIGQISEGLKNIGKELDITVIALSQLSRQCEMRPDHHPQISDLRDSGNLEQDADIIMFLYRDDYYAERESDRERKKPNKLEIMIAKSRDGEVGMLELDYITSIQKITEPLGYHPAGGFDSKIFEG